MSDKKPKDESGAPPPGDKRSGRVGFDERGNSVWEWQLETGVYSRDVNTQKLKKLELGDLSIAETAVNKRPPGIEQASMPGGGFNPYDNSPQVGGGFNPYDNAHALGRKFAPQAPAPGKPAPPAQRKPVDLKKLEEWMRAKKLAEQNKDDED